MRGNEYAFEELSFFKDFFGEIVQSKQSFQFKELNNVLNPVSKTKKLEEKATKFNEKRKNENCASLALGIFQNAIFARKVVQK